MTREEIEEVKNSIIRLYSTLDLMGVEKLTILRGYRPQEIRYLLSKTLLALESRATESWIDTTKELPPHSHIIAYDGLKNYPWIPSGIVTLKDEKGNAHCYDGQGFSDCGFDTEKFLKGREITSASGEKYFIPPREVVSWCMLPNIPTKEKGGD